MKRVKPLNTGQKRAVIQALVAAKRAGAGAPPGGLPPGAGMPPGGAMPPGPPPMPPGPPQPGMKRGGKTHTFIRGGVMPEHAAPYDAAFKKSNRKFAKGGMTEGSAAEEAAESPAFEKKEGKKGEKAERFKGRKYASGGSVVCSAGGRIGRGDGIAVRGHTRGKMC